MTRRYVPDYAGARGRLSIADVASLSPSSYAVQEKVDGMYAQVHLDSRGRVSAIRSRTGAELSRALVGDLIGIELGAPWSVLVGELEAHTEAGNRLAACRGWRNVHLFDCVRAGDRYLAREPYRARRDALWRMQSQIADPSRLSATRDPDGWRDRRTGRYVAAPRDWRRFPIIDQRPPGAASELWDRATVGDAEGLVVVALDAPLGRRRAKLKVKPTETLDAVVVAVERTVIACTWAGGRFHVGRGKAEVSVGDVVEVAYDGFYERDAAPRFARLVRRRADLAVR